MEEDKKKNFAEAVRLYEHGIEHFLYAIKCELLQCQRSLNNFQNGYDIHHRAFR